MRRVSPKRDLSEAAIVDALRKSGCSVYLVSAKDFPDLALGMPWGETVLAEVKTGKAKLRPGQTEFRDSWRGGRVVTLRTVEDALALLGVGDRSERRPTTRGTT